MKKSFNCNCKYCTVNGYIWSIDNKKIWIEIPKNGSSVLKYKYFENKKRNLINEVEMQNYNSGFVILRNPIDRFKSLLSHYFIDGNRSNFGKLWFNNNINNLNYSKKNISKFVIDNWDSIDKISAPHHWNPQSFFIPDSFFNLKNIEVYDIKDLSKNFNVPITNTSSSSDIYLSQSCLNFIEKKYKKDFHLFQKYIK